MPERTRIIDVSERRAFRTIYEAINWCVGTDYRYWGRACWPSVWPTDGFRMWFTQLAHIEHGRYVPSVNQCLNLLCCNGNYHVFDDWKQSPSEPMRNQTWKYDLIFSKEVGGYYYFRGVFVADTVHSQIHHYVSKRVATKAKLIGCPARRIELLDSVPEVEFDENYLKKHIVSSDVVDIGLSIPARPVQTKQQVIVNRPTPKPIIQKPAVDYKAKFPEGCKVKHRKFGTGIVKKTDKGIITVQFNSGEIKDLGAEFCVEKGLLEKLD